MAVTAAHSKQSVIYIDTGGVFSPARILECVDHKTDTDVSSLFCVCYRTTSVAQGLLSCQPRVTVMSCFVYKDIRAL